MRRRLLSGPARFYVATLVVVLVAVGLFAVARSQQQPAASPVATLAPGVESPLHQALKGIHDDGTWSKQTALAVFAASFGPLPGVPVPTPDPSYRSGSLAIRMVEAYWSELTDAQRAAIKVYIGPSAASAVPAAYHPAYAALLDTYKQIVDQAVADVGAGFGRPLSIPYTVVLGDAENGAAWAWATGTWTGPLGSLASSCTMTFPPSTAADPSRTPYLRWLVLHEVWHCFEYSMTDFLTFKASPPWVTEGSASWVAEAVTGGAGAPPPELDHWRDYILDPGKPLYKRDYDAVGFYAQLVHNSIDPWKVIDLMVKAGGSDQAFQASGANTSTFSDQYGSSWFRDAQPNNEWAMQSGFGIPDASVHAPPSPIPITDGAEGTISAQPLAGAIAAIDTTAFVTRFDVSGVGRVADPAGAGLDVVIRAGRLDLCTNPGGDCTCPPGSTKTPTTPKGAPEMLHAMASGEEHNTSVMDIHGLSKDDWCGAKTTPAPEAGDLCKSGCAGSNGDPHLRTVDKASYDLQSVGEYVLLRSADGTLEIQGRQERASSGANASVNTAVAVKVNGHRVGFYNTNTNPGGPASVKVDGVAVDAAAADLGPGATLISLPRGYELDFPDGSRLWVLAAAKASISITVVPSAALKASAVGLLARIPSNAGLRVPATPDGKTFPVPLTPQEKYHDIYGLFAPSWRVTATTTLFDYDAGKTTDTYTLADFPPLTVPETIAELPPTAVTSAQTTCAGVIDSDLLQQCVYDVAVTGTTEFATLYTMSDDLQADGPSSMSLPAPGTSPTPPPSLGQATGVNLVADHVIGVTAATLGPDGTVYVEVGEAGQGFGDFTRALLVVDPATGKVRQRAVPVAYGMLATAAGSLWAGEFKRGDTGCQVSRLDPVTLAVQAGVTTVCSGGGQTDFATVGDAIWFIDPTGADSTGAGGHLRRIDPATNRVDTTPGGTIDLPFVAQTLHVPGTALFATTSNGLVYGDHQHGVYYLDAGGGSFQKLPVPADASISRMAAGGAGVWVQTVIGTSSAPEGSATFAAGGQGNGDQVGINGYLIGADDSALYAEVSDDDTQPVELWRFPLDRSVPARIAVSGFAPNGFGGQQRLIYRDPGAPFLMGANDIVKLWVVPSPTTPDQASLVMQAVPIP